MIFLIINWSNFVYLLVDPVSLSVRPSIRLLDGVWHTVKESTCADTSDKNKAIRITECDIFWCLRINSIISRIPVRISNTDADADTEN